MMTGDARGEVVAALAEAVTALRLGHPTRVAVEGHSAAGKTTLTAAQVAYRRETR